MPIYQQDDGCKFIQCDEQRVSFSFHMALYSSMQIEQSAHRYLQLKGHTMTSTHRQIQEAFQHRGIDVELKPHVERMTNIPTRFETRTVDALHIQA